MATIVDLGRPWDPGAGFRAMLDSSVRTQALVASSIAMRQPLASALAHEQQLASLTASLAAAQTSMKPLLDSLDRYRLQQIAARMPTPPDFSDPMQGWRKQSEQLRVSVQFLRDHVPVDLSFPPETLDQAETLLGELAQNPPARALDTIGNELTAETEAQVEEAVRVIEPALRGMDRTKAKALVIAYVTALVFVLSVALSRSYPKAAELLAETTGGNPLIYASAAGWLAGKVWDRLDEEPEDPDQ